MMPQMGENSPVHESPSYRRGYEGGQYQQQGQGPASGLDDNYVEAIAQRIVQRLNQNGAASGKIYARSNALSAGQRLALAIVSVAMLVPLAAITLSAVGGFVGLFSFGAVCVAIIIINGVFNIRN